MAATLHVFSCKSSVKEERDAFAAIVSVLPEATRRELLLAQGRIALVAEPDEGTTTPAK